LNKKVCLIGDSLTNNGTITQTLLDIAGTDVMGVTLIGTRGSGSNKHEGRGGWTVAAYTSNYSDATGANPFWKSGAVNFAQYLTDNSLATPDWVFIQLGTNDVFAQSSDASCSVTSDTILNNLDTLINSIKAADAAVKVGLMIPPPPAASQDAFGANYSSGQVRWRFKRNILIFARQMIAKYAGQEASRVYLVPSNTAVDTVNNFTRAAAAPVNSRNSSVTIARQSDSVHPASTGYQQIGDALWAFLKYYA
jgi:lysophospholipase L1-like esterase